MSGADDERTAELVQILRDALTLPLSQVEVTVLCCALAIDYKDVIGAATLYQPEPTQEWLAFMNDDSPW